MEEEVAREEQLKLVQDVRVYPVGRVLRDTFNADNHDTLTSDVTGLMINLSRVPYEPLATGPDKVTTPPLPPPGVLRRLARLLQGR